MWYTAQKARPSAQLLLKFVMSIFCREGKDRKDYGNTREPMGLYVLPPFLSTFVAVKELEDIIMSRVTL